MTFSQNRTVNCYMIIWTINIAFSLYSGSPVTLKAWLSDKKKKKYMSGILYWGEGGYISLENKFFNEWEEWKQFKVTAQPSSITTKSWFAQPLLEWLKKTKVGWKSNKNRFYSGNIAIMRKRPLCGTCSIPNKTEVSGSLHPKSRVGIMRVC